MGAAALRRLCPSTVRGSDTANPLEPAVMFKGICIYYPTKVLRV